MHQAYFFISCPSLPPQVAPLTDFALPSMNEASRELIAAQATTFTGEKILMQVGGEGRGGEGRGGEGRGEERRGEEAMLTRSQTHGKRLGHKQIE